MTARSITVALAAVASARDAGNVVSLSRLLDMHAAQAHVASSAIKALFDIAEHEAGHPPRAFGFPNLSLPVRRSLAQACLKALRLYKNFEGLVVSTFTILSHAMHSADGLLPAAERSLVVADGVPTCVAALRHNIRSEDAVIMGCKALYGLSRHHFAWRDSALAIGVVTDLRAVLRLVTRTYSRSPSAPEFLEQSMVVFRVLADIFEAVEGGAAASGSAVRAEACGTMADVVAAMRVATGDEALQTWGCHALRQVASSVVNDSNACPSHTVWASAYDAVVAVITAHPHGHDNTLGSAFQAMTTILRDWQQLGDTQMGFVAGLVQTALTTRLNSYQTVVGCFGSLTMIPQRFGERPPRGLDACELVRAVLAGMRAHPHCGGLQKQGALTLMVLSENTADGFHAYHELGGAEAIEDVMRAHPQHADDLRLAAAFTAERAKRQMCAWPECGAVRGGPSQTKLQQCAACRQVRYCSRACQTAHWPEHKAACRAAQAAQRADAGAADGTGGAT